MKHLKHTKTLLICMLLLCIYSCETKQKDVKNLETSEKQNEELFHTVLNKHLNAVTNKDLAVLKSTMSPKGDMELIQPSAEIVYSVDGFMQFHQEWFDVPNWTFKTKVLSTHIGSKIGVATVEILYEEPERNGKPYFNRMIVSYTLEKIDGNWYIIKDHASSVEKTQN